MSKPNSLRELISVRFKEYTREPEALFWSFGFPILLAIGLGIAFRTKPADTVHVAVIRGVTNADGLLARHAARAGAPSGQTASSRRLRPACSP